MKKLHARLTLSGYSQAWGDLLELVEEGKNRLRLSLAQTLADDSAQFAVWDVQDGDKDIPGTRVVAATLMVLEDQDIEDISTLLANAPTTLNEGHKDAYERLWQAVAYYRTFKR